MTRTELRYLDIPLGNGAVLRVGLMTGPDAAEGGDVLLACGFPDRLPWPRIMAEAINVPAAALPELRDALSRLEGER